MDRKNIIKLHLMLWGLAVSMQLLTIFSEIGEDKLFIIFSHNLLEIIFRAFCFYVFYFASSFLFVPVFRGKNRAIIFTLFSLLFIGILNILFTYIYIAVRYPSETLPLPQSQAFRYIYFDLITYQFVFSVTGLALRATTEWYKKSKNQEQLELQNILDELTLLNSKINPDFLFNALYNIDSLIEKDSDKASYYIIKLSGIMWYLLYNTGTGKVPLQEEIELINNYIELESLRYPDSGFIRFKSEGNSSDISIYPLLFMPLLANAFNFEINRLERPGIIIHLNIKSDIIHFVIVNAIQGTIDFSGDKRTEIIYNLKRRLELIYENNYKLDVSINKNQYSAELEIKYK